MRLRGWWLPCALQDCILLLGQPTHWSCEFPCCMSCLSREANVYVCISCFVCSGPVGVMGLQTTRWKISSSSSHTVSDFSSKNANKLEYTHKELPIQAGQSVCDLWQRATFNKERVCLKNWSHCSSPVCCVNQVDVVWWFECLLSPARKHHEWMDYQISFVWQRDVYGVLAKRDSAWTTEEGPLQRGMVLFMY